MGPLTINHCVERCWVNLVVLTVCGNIKLNANFMLCHEKKKKKKKKKTSTWPTFFVMMFPCSSVNCSSLTCSPGTSSTSSPCRWGNKCAVHTAGSFLFFCGTRTARTEQWKVAKACNLLQFSILFVDVSFWNLSVLWPWVSWKDTYYYTYIIIIIIMRKNRRQRQTNEVRRSQRLLQKHVSPPSSTIYPASSIITAHQRYDNNSCTPCTAIYTPTGIPEAGVGVGLGWGRGGSGRACRPRSNCRVGTESADTVGKIEAARGPWGI